VARKRDLFAPAVSFDSEELTDSKHPRGHFLKRWTKSEGFVLDLMCAHTDRGERSCRHYGTLSYTTLGHGPFWCREHFDPEG
jgi:hypothetical protein